MKIMKMKQTNEHASSVQSTTQLPEPDFALINNPEDVFDEQLCRMIDHLDPIRFELEFYKGELEEEAIVETYYQIDNSNDNETKLILKCILSKEFEVTLRNKISIIIQHLFQLAEVLESPMGTNNGVAYRYQSSHWIKLEDEDLKLFLVEVAYKCGINKFEAQAADTIKLLSQQYFAVGEIQLANQKPDEVKINFSNGTLVVENGKYSLRPFDPKDFMTYKLDINYDIDVSCPQFQAFLDEVLPDQESQMVIAEYLGYVFTKNLKLEKCLVLLGSGANGKGVIFEIVRAILNDSYISSFTLSNLCDDKGYHRAALGGKLLNYSSELGGKNCDADMIKKLISNEPVDARLPYGRAFELKNYCKFMFNANTLPCNMEHSHAYFRRFMFVEFNYTVPVEKRNPDLANQIIATELNGIFNWILKGLDRVISQRKFTVASAIEATSQRIQKESNSVAVFLDDSCYIKSINMKTPFKMLSNQYNEYCKDNNYRAVSNVELSRRLNSLGYEVVRGTNNIRVVYCEIKTTAQVDEIGAFLDKITKH